MPGNESNKKMYNFQRFHGPGNLDAIRIASTRLNMALILFLLLNLQKVSYPAINFIKDKMTPEKMAEVVGQYILDEELDDCIEYSEKSKKFKLKLPAAGLPENIFKAMKGVTKETTTTFDGVKLKVRMLPASLLPERLLAELKALGQTYNFSDWIAKMLDEKQTRREETGEAFYKKVTRYYPNHRTFLH